MWPKAAPSLQPKLRPLLSMRPSLQHLPLPPPLLQQPLPLLTLPIAVIVPRPPKPLLLLLPLQQVMPLERRIRLYQHLQLWLQCKGVWSICGWIWSARSWFTMCSHLHQSNKPMLRPMSSFPTVSNTSPRRSNSMHRTTSIPRAQPQLTGITYRH